MVSKKKTLRLNGRTSQKAKHSTHPHSNTPKDQNWWVSNINEAKLKKFKPQLQ
jgi:hypothetical protein